MKLREGESKMPVPEKGQTIRVEIVGKMVRKRGGGQKEIPYRALRFGVFDAKLEIPSPTLLASAPIVPHGTREEEGCRLFDSLVYRLGTISLQANRDVPKLVEKLGEMLITMKAATAGVSTGAQCPSCGNLHADKEFSGSAELSWFVMHDGLTYPAYRASEPCLECVDSALKRATSSRAGALSGPKMRDEDLTDFVTDARYNSLVLQSPESFDPGIAFLTKLQRNIRGGLPLRHGL